MRSRIISILAGLIIFVGVFAIGVFYGAESLLEHYHSQIEQTLSNELGWKISYDRAALTFLPTLGLDLKNVSLSPAPECSQPIQIAHITLRAKLGSLLQKSFKIREVKFSGGAVALSVNNGQFAIERNGIAACDMPKLPEAALSKPSQISKASAAPPIDLEIEEVSFSDISVTLKGSNHQTTITNAFANSALETTDGRLILKNIECGAKLAPYKFNISAALFTYDPVSHAVALDQGVLNLNEKKIRFGAMLGPEGKLQTLSLRSEIFTLSELTAIYRAIFGRKTPAFTGEGMKIDVSISRSTEGTLAGSGSLSIQHPSIMGELSKAQVLTLKNLQLENSKNSWKIASDLALDQYDAADEQSRYHADKIEGTLAALFNADLTPRLTASLTVRNFRYVDPETQVENVNATLTKIEGVIMSQGDVRVTTELKSDTVTVRNPGVILSKVSQVQAPITVTIGSKGGYSVEGPVSFQGVDLHTMERDFKNLNGKIAMLISGPLKSFSSEKVAGEIEGKPFAAAMDFKMHPDKYELVEGRIAFEPGSASAKGMLQRRGLQRFTARLQFEEVPIKHLAQMAKQSDAENYLGVLNAEGQFAGALPDWKERLSGSGKATIANRISKTYNLGDKLKGIITEIPGLSGLVSEDPDQSDAQYAQSKFTFGIAEKKINFSEVQIFRPRYTVAGSGTVDFDLNIRATAEAIFLRETLGALGFGNKAISNLIGGLATLRIPLKVDGNVARPNISLDKMRLAEKASGLGLLKSILGVGSMKATPTPTQEGATNHPGTQP